MRYPTLPLLLSGLALAGAASLALAGDETTASPSADAHAARRAQVEQAFLDRVDSNHDGLISRAEYQTWIDSRFDRLDANRDGRIDATEIAHSPAAEQRAQRRAEKFVQHFSGSADGSVSKADFEARSMQRFDRVSAGSDTASAEQLLPHRGAWRHRHGKASANPDPAGG